MYIVSVKTENFKMERAYIGLGKVNMRLQELIQSDPHQAPNTKGKNRKIQ